MVEIAPKHLRQIGTGRIYAYAPELAKRKDMVPVEEVAKPAPPLIEVVPTGPPPDVTPVIEEASGGSIEGINAEAGVKRVRK